MIARRIFLGWLVGCGMTFAASIGRTADWIEPMRKVNKAFVGNAGYVAQFGDSITYSMAFWTPVGWMEPDEFLTADDGMPKRPAATRWRDTFKGMRAKGPEHANYSGWTVRNLLEAVPAVLAREQPEVAIVMIGTNDTGPDGPPADYAASLEKLLRLILDAHCIPVLNTIPPKRGAETGVEKTNRIIRGLADKLNLPLVDYHAEILRRQPGGASFGTLIDADGVHPSGGETGRFDAANLARCGYALRTWLNFLTVRELYFKVLSVPKPSTAGIESIRSGTRCAVLADTQVSKYADAHEDETVWNWGSAPQIKCKGWEEYALLRFDMTPCRNQAVTRATLYLSRSEMCAIDVAGISTISADWSEGKGGGRPGDLPVEQQGRDSAGGATFLRAVHPDTTWAGIGSTFKSVTYGHGGSFWRALPTAPARDTDGQLYYAIDLPPEFAQALQMGDDAYGLAVSDEKGQRQFQDFYGQKARANHFLKTRESGKPCFLVVETQPAVPFAPAMVAVPAAAPGAEAGEVLLSWICPADATGKPLLGYRVFVAKGQVAAADLTETHRLPRHLTWRPGLPGERQVFPVGGLEPGATYTFGVVAYDRQGATSPCAVFRGAARASRAIALRPAPAAAPADGSPLENATLRVWACATGEKIDPRSGNALSEGGYGRNVLAGHYRDGNESWDGLRHTITLQAGRNDFAGFQLAIENRLDRPLRGLRLEQSPLRSTTGTIAADNAEWFWQWNLRDRDETWYPDALVPVADLLAIPSAPNGIPGQKVQAFYADVWVPHRTPPGTYRGELSVSAEGAERLVVPIELTVRDFVLPDTLNYVCDMNGYAYPPTADWEGTLALHRLAHRNRLNVNIVPYSHRGNWTVPQMAMDVRGEGRGRAVVSFESFDRYFGPLLDGSAFAQNPRAGVPIAACYLNLYENWPCKLSEGFMLDRTATHVDIRADFSPAYREGFMAVCRQMAEHFKIRGYNRTAFQVFLNNKYQYAPETTFWLLDEPMFRDDYLIIDLFGDLVRQGFAASNPVRVDYRVDCSRVEEARGAMVRVDTMVFAQSNVRAFPGVASEFMRAYDPARPARSRQAWEYGGAGDVRSLPVGLRGWVLESWLEGRDGLLPWLAYGTDASWENAEAAENAVFYPALSKWRYNGCYGSLRMKAFRDGQQDVECLLLLARKLGVTRRELAAAIRPYVTLRSAVHTDGRDARAEDAGAIAYRGLTPDALAYLRRVVGDNLAQEGAAP